MKYRVFESQSALDTANAAWMAARTAAGVYDMRNGQPITPQITSKWSDGRAMLDGRLACPVPDQWADAYGGVELELSDGDFAEIQTELP